MKATVVITLIAVGLLTAYALRADEAVESTIDIEFGSLPLASSPLPTATGLFSKGIQPVLFWHIVTVDSKVAYASSLVLDTDDHPHVSYPATTPLDNDLNYAEWTGSQWQIEKADPMNQYRWTGKPILKLDGAGYPHIGYDVCNEFSCDLNYAHWTGSQWIIQQIDSGISGVSISMALDESDSPHFSYCRQHGDSIELRYTYWASSEWVTETIDADRKCWYSTSIDLDSYGRPHISYYNSDAGDLIYTHWTETTWLTQTVDSTGYVGDSNSLMLDSNDKPHIGYFNWSQETLKYAVWTGSDWNIQTIDSAGNLRTPSLVLDDQNNAYITYTGAGNNTIKFARWTGNEWYIYVVDSGSNSWLALDSTNQPHITYWNNGLKYAWGQLLILKTYLPMVITGQLGALITRDER